MTAGRDFFPARRQPQVTRPAADAATFAESVAAILVPPGDSAVVASGAGTTASTTQPVPGGAGNFAFLDAITDFVAWWDDPEGEEAWT